MLTAGGSECNAITEQPPANSSDRRVTDVLDQDVLGVLDGHGADLFQPRTSYKYKVARITGSGAGGGQTMDALSETRSCRERWHPAARNSQQLVRSIIFWTFCFEKLFYNCVHTIRHPAAVEARIQEGEIDTATSKCTRCNFA